MTPYPATVFDRPQWTLLPDPKGPRQYANVSNVLEMTRGRLLARMAVAVPTDLFTLMAQVLKVPVEASAALAIDMVGDWYVFSLHVIGDTESLHDLWAYPAKGLPAWMLDPSYHL